MMRLALPGRVGGFSAARFSGMPAAVLSESDPAPKIFEKHCNFLAEGHGLIKIGQKIR